MYRRMLLPAAAVLALALATAPSRAVVNPDISVIGQPFARWTDAGPDPARRRVTLDPGETEIVFDAYLNPYARGTFIAAFGGQGLELEEGYFVLSRGLPAGMSLKAGKYRVGFGRLNPVHPHAYPFAERFGVLAAYLPGEEAFGETGVQASELVALPGDVALTLAVDWLQGDTFRVPRADSGDPADPLASDPENGDRQTEPRPAGLARAALFVPWGDRSGVELGVSGTRGSNNVAARSRTTLLGADLKTKLWTGPRSAVIVQGELLRLDHEVASWDPALAAYATTRVRPIGGYVFADYSLGGRWDVGASYERFQQPTSARTWDQAFGVFAGLALMEETTMFRLDWLHARPGRPPGAPGDPDSANTLTFRVVYSMGPHKAHSF